MSYTKEMMMQDVKTCKRLIEHIEEELELADTWDDGKVIPWNTYGKRYSLGKVKRDCIAVREILNNVRKGCEQ